MYKNIINYYLSIVLGSKVKGMNLCAVLWLIIHNSNCSVENISFTSYFFLLKYFIFIWENVIKTKKEMLKIKIELDKKFFF